MSQASVLQRDLHTLARTLIGFTVAFGLAGVIGRASLAADQLIAGANVNVVGGPTCTKASDPNCPFAIYGDHTVQRQNEGSGACSARNPANCLVAGNDYRLVNSGIVPAVDGKVTADAWQGVYWTHDGGSTWRSTLLPGWPGDPSPEGAVSPISGFEAAADATVRPGVAGLLGVSGIAFNRVAETAAAPISGGEGKSGVQFFSLYFDDNVPVDPDGPLTYADVPPRYIRTVIVDSGTSGRFLDKPWHTWDIPRPGANNSCIIPAGAVGGKPVPQQTVPSGNLYIAYATFLGTGNNQHGNIWFKSSTDCGAHWSNATKLTESVPISQSPFLSINPASGAVHVVWREFGQNGLPDRILTVKSTNLGKSFTKPVEIVSFGVPSASTSSTAFDAFSQPTATVTDRRQARSNDYPSACISTDGKTVRVVYSQRIQQSGALAAGKVMADATGWSRIVMQTSPDGLNWSAPPQAVDNPLVNGHQFQPSIVCTGTRATVMWYDQRNDGAFSLDRNQYPFVFYPFIIDPLPLPPVHTIDVRAAQTNVSGSAFDEPSIQVSRYPVAFDTSVQDFIQLQYSFVNWPLFGNGLVPFIGDYLDAFVKNPFRPPIGSAGWSFNTFTLADGTPETPIVYGLWTDNRDVLQINSVASPGDPNWVGNNVSDLDWTNFAAPGESCTSGKLTWTRNQNLYVSGLTRGVVMLAEGNARRSPDIEQRAYVIFIQNQTPPEPGSDGKYGTDDDINKRRFTLSFGQGSGPASFDSADPTVTELFLDVPAFSGVTRSVFLPKGSTAPVIVVVVEVGGSLKSSVIIAPDTSAPSDPVTQELHDVSLTLTPLTVLDQNNQPTTTLTYPNTSADIDTTIISPTFVSPTFVSNVLNPTFVSPTFVSPTFVSPTFVSPTFVSPTFVSPTFVSPTFVSPTFVSPTFVSPTFVSQPLETDAAFAVAGTGTVTSSYDLDTLIASIRAGATYNIQVNKLYEVPGTNDCTRRRQVVQQLVSNVTSRNSADVPGDVITNSSFSLAPGEQALITLRVACTGSTPCYNPNTDLSLVVKGHARNCKTTPAGGCSQKPPKQAVDHVPPKLTVPGRIVVKDNGAPGEIVTYEATAKDFVDGPIPIGPRFACNPPSGSLFPAGDTTVTCTAKDEAGNTATASFVVTVQRRL